MQADKVLKALRVLHLDSKATRRVLVYAETEEEALNPYWAEPDHRQPQSSHAQ